MVSSVLATPIGHETNCVQGTSAPEILDAPQEAILRTVESDDEELEEWYRAEVMPVLYGEESALAEFDCC